MKVLARCAVVLSAVSLAGAAWAGENKPEPQLRLELNLVDGSHIIGVPGIESVPMQTSYAKMDVPLREILTITMGEDHETASLELRNGDKLKGVIDLGPLRLDALFGKAVIGIEHMQPRPGGW